MVYSRLPSTLCFPITQSFTQFRNSFPHDDRENAEHEQENACASDHHNGGDDIQQVIDHNIDHAQYADHREENWRERQTARADDNSIDKYGNGLEEQHNKVDQSLRAIADHLNVCRAKQSQL